MSGAHLVEVTLPDFGMPEAMPQSAHTIIVATASEPGIAPAASCKA